MQELLLIDPSDKRRIFYEGVKRLFYVMSEVEPDDVDDPILNQFMVVADKMSNVLYAIGIKRRLVRRGRNCSCEWAHYN